MSARFERLGVVDRDQFTAHAPGKLVPTTGGGIAFVPAALPPQFEISPDVLLALDGASSALGMLGGVGRLLPNPHLLISPYLRREAVLSSRIEGTQSTIADVYAAEAGQTQLFEDTADVSEVQNYVLAHELGLRRLSELPLSLRLIRDLHKRLMHSVRGGDQTPGRFRDSQNFIGPPGTTIANATYVPPPVPEMKRALDDLERFLHDRALPPLMQIAIAHYQFEAIHPFRDGNGRVGRLLISMFLCERGLLPAPLLYLSAYFERTRSDYYDLLMRVSTHGDWSAWLRYFLEGVRAQATEAVEDSQRLLGLRESCRATLIAANARPTAIKLLDSLFANPYITARTASTQLKVSDPTARAAISDLLAHGVLEEISGRRWGQVFLATNILAALQGHAQE
jgi:Fic family protein